nr:UDP-glucuronosyltransferase 1-9-like [Onthophagus taurus]
MVVSPSHHIWNEALVDVNPLLESMDGNFIKEISQDSTLLAVLAPWKYTPFMCRYCFESEEFKKILNYPKDFFDLLVFDVTFAHCFFPLIDYFGKPPVIGITAFGMQPYISDIIGQRIESYSPYYNLPYTNKMTFFERFYSVIHQKVELLSKWYYLEEVTEESKRFFGKNILNLDEYEKSISLIFSNDDPIMDYPKAFPPNVIPIGGVHLKEPKKLEGDLQKIMDDSKNGVILVSMGSNFKADHYSDDVKSALIEAFSRLKLTILWKFEDELKVSKNVYLRRWLPQRDILAHPNTKLFITHCGGLSTQETIVRGVPVVGIPLFMDQYNKAAKFKATKSGIILKYSELTADIIFDGVNEVLSNPEYKENMMRLSNLYKNQPQKPIDKFLIWVDYVLKNGHLDHLSVSARYMKWYQVDNWDIFGFCLVILFVTLYVFKKVCCFVSKCFKRNSSGKQKMH